MEPPSDSSDELARAFHHRDEPLVQTVSRMTHGATALVPDLIGPTLGVMADDVAHPDLASGTRFAVERTPATREALETIVSAVDVLVGIHGVSTEQAHGHLEESAARAGIPALALALMILHDRD